MTISLQQRIRALLDDPAASYWLKHALAGALRRDPVDAANDAEALSALLAERADDSLGGAGNPVDAPEPTRN